MTLYGYNTKLNEVQVTRAIRSGFGLSSKNKDLSVEKNYDSGELDKISDPFTRGITVITRAVNSIFSI